MLNSDESDTQYDDSDLESAYDMMHDFTIDDEGEEYELIDDDDDDVISPSNHKQVVLIDSNQGMDEIKELQIAQKQTPERKRQRKVRKRLQTVFDSDDEEGIRIQQERRKVVKKKWNSKSTMNTIRSLNSQEVDEIDTDDLLEQVDTHLKQKRLFVIR